jgi:hypothetical protein
LNVYNFTSGGLNPTDNSDFCFCSKCSSFFSPKISNVKSSENKTTADDKRHEERKNSIAQIDFVCAPLKTLSALTLCRRLLFFASYGAQRVAAFNWRQAQRGN